MRALPFLLVGLLVGCDLSEPGPAFDYLGSRSWLEVWEIDRATGAIRRVHDDWKVEKTWNQRVGWQMDVLGFTSDGRLAYSDSWRGFAQTLDLRTGEVERFYQASWSHQPIGDHVSRDRVIGKKFGQWGADTLRTLNLLTHEAAQFPLPDTVLHARWPVFLGDDHLAFAASTPGPSTGPTFIVDADTGDLKWRLPDYVRSIMAARDFPTGSPLLVLANSGPNGTTVLNLDTGERTSIGGGHHTSLSPDAGWILYYADAPVNDRWLETIRTDGTGRRSYDPSLVIANGRAPISPDSKLFAATTAYTDSLDEAAAGVFEIDPMTGEQTRLVPYTAFLVGLALPSYERLFITPLTYSEDGRRLYVTVLRHQHYLQ